LQALRTSPGRAGW